MGFIHTKGSEWRKWDLHIHTPASFHWNAGKRLWEMNDTEKSAALTQMLNTINDSDVAVFAITDYWTFDGYIEFMTFIEQQGLELKKTVFPGMELRIEAATDYRLNMQVILSNKLSIQQLVDFKSKLTLRNVNRSISDEALKQLARTLDSSKARIHGYNPPTELNEELLLELGSKVAEVTKISLEHAFDTIPKNYGYILMPYDTSDGLQDLSWERHPLEDNYFMKAAHIFETRDQRNVDLFLGKETEQNKRFISNFQFTLGNKPKPALCGSDAHKFSDYGVYPSNKATWIKADPNFNGLTQIIHEPESRVKIDQNRPNNKISYLVIDKVKFNDNRADKEFSDEWIELNEGLNVIIGGKSSGKSLLLHCIAKSIDPQQVVEKTSKSSNRSFVYDFEKHPDFNFEVKWFDGSVNYLSEDSENKSLHQITYIPQLYINFLADETGQENLREIVLNILLQNNNFNKFYSDVMEGVRNHSTEIDKEITTLFTLKEEMDNIREQIFKLGNKETINLEIKKIDDEINQLRVNSGFSEEEEVKYNSLISNKNNCELENNRLSTLKTALASFEKEIKNATTIYAAAVKNTMDQLSKQFESDDKSNLFVKPLVEGIALKLGLTLREVISYVKYDEIDSLIKSETEKNEKITEDLKPFLSKFENRTRLEELQKNQSAQKNILKSIQDQETRLNIEIEKYNDHKRIIFEHFVQIQESYQLINNELNKNEYNQISEDMTLETKVCFEKQRFYKQFTDSFNRQKKLHKILPTCFDENDDLMFSTFEEHVSIIQNVFNNLLVNNEFKLKGAYELKTVVRALFENYYYFDFNLIQKNDPFMHMSPGKRGLVLLQLFLHLSNSTHPILIDQPEDNLDNRTIYTELNAFVKNKKVNRQIIIVTHNANLVVLTDAEQVIVANQAGQQIQRENEKYRFEYVSGSLECSFHNPDADGVLQQKGIKEHVCEILEGGQEAFEKREKKYGF